MNERQISIHEASRRGRRVCVFGGARIAAEGKEYKQIQKLGSLLALSGFDVVTGGGPGAMEAANRGAFAAGDERGASIGITIQLESEPVPNPYLDAWEHARTFPSRLDRMFDGVCGVIGCPGGIGTLLEVFYTWQLIQAKHVTRCSLVLIGGAFWEGLLGWVREGPMREGLVSAEVVQECVIVDSPEEAVSRVQRNWAGTIRLSDDQVFEEGKVA